MKTEESERGQVLAKPGTITPHTDFDAEIYVLTKRRGEDTPFSKIQTSIYFRTTDVTGEVLCRKEPKWLCQGIRRI